MIKFLSLLCLVCGSLAQWSDPDWKMNSWIGEGRQKFPPLPGSYPVLLDTTGPPTEKTVKPSGATEQTTVPTTESTTNPTTTPPTTIPTTAPPTPTPTHKCPKIFSCADCNTAQVCRPSAKGLVPVKSLPCDSTTPYCNAASGSCSTVPDATCGLQDNFICPADGYFPDPTNCAIYHACNNYTAQMFKCAENQNYDPERAQCSQDAKCSFSTHCLGVSEQKLEMGDTHFFTYCSGGQPLMVSRCPGEYKLNSTSQVCEPICEHDGLMADLADCTKFYKCYRQFINDTVSYPIRQNLLCPDGEAFAPDSFQCIPKTLTNCTM